MACAEMDATGNRFLSPSRDVLGVRGCEDGGWGTGDEGRGVEGQKTTKRDVSGCKARFVMLMKREGRERERRRGGTQK